MIKNMWYSQSKSDKIPIILCSRGEHWGKKVNQPGWDILAQGGHILDAVEKSANVTELDPEDMSVGYGGIPNENGVVELDASIMYGPTHNCGSVASLRHIKTPSSVARFVMERTDHIMLVGKGALKFALAHGFKKESLLTEKARLAWLRWKENLNDGDDWLPPQDDKYEVKERSTGTINILTVDQNGDIAGITTTSGLAFKIPGRVGDSPIIGAGLYVDNEVGAAGATGRGEEVIRTCGSFLVVEIMRQGKSPQQACEAACKRIIEVNGGIENIKKNRINDKFVAVNKQGEVGCAAIIGSSKRRPQLSYINKTGFHVYNGSIMIET
ncbi:MAG: N(4)-(beta-N-acetylglucosaminyl)-L-asparaginase [bacterium]|nr:MAG: N(4)-(beta-N-acetylglucosaminyl)-L-asparaginase [bacterium]